MADKHASRFDAETVARAVAIKQRRLELRFSSPAGELLVVSLPLHEAVAVARLICDYDEQTPFGGHAERQGERQGGTTA